MKKYTKQDQINDLIITYNEQRVKAGKKPVKLFWTGLAYRIHTDEQNKIWIGPNYSIKEFIAFLDGLLIDHSL